MPAVGFVRPDGTNETFEAALSHPEVYGLPRGLLAALAHDRKRYCDVSVSELIAPIQATVLRERHDYYIEPLDRLWAVFGTSAHVLMERGAAETDLAERRMTLQIDGVLVGGMPDLLVEDGTLWDYKTTAVYKIKAIRQGERPTDWENQLNVYAHFYREHKRDVKALKICALLKDHRNYEAERAKDGYPSPVEVLELPLWPADIARDYLWARVAAWRNATELDDAALPLCSDEERWARPDKSGRIKYNRCERYCEVRSVCPQIGNGVR